MTERQPLPASRHIVRHPSPALGALTVLGMLALYAQRGHAQTPARAPSEASLRYRDFGLEQPPDDPRLRSDVPRMRATATRERVNLYEALGDVDAERKALTAALSSNAAADETLWLLKFELERRLGESAAALDTLTQMLERFPGTATRERLAHLQLALGRPKEALATLQAAPGAKDERSLRRLALIAFEVGDLDAERRIYERLTMLKSAGLYDYQRLLALARDNSSALRIALAAFERFDSAEMLSSALDIYAAEGNENAQLALLARGERIASLVERRDYWQSLITLRQRRAARAVEDGRFAEAKQELAAAAELLGRATVRARDSALFDRLWDAQRAQSLSLGLTSSDKAYAARAYADYKKRLSVRERVYVLARLGRSDEALRMARQALKEGNLSAADRWALQDDVRYLGRSLSRYVQASGEAVDMGDVVMLRAAATVQYGNPSWGLGGGASFNQFRPAQDGLVIDVEQHDIVGQLHARIKFATLEVGLSVRNEISARPFGSLVARLWGDESAGGRLRLHLNDTAADNARVRVLAVSDAVAFETTLPLVWRLYLTGRVAGDMFREREKRTHLGTGLTVDAGLGATVVQLRGFGDAGVRLVTRIAPRYPRSPEALPPEIAKTVWMQSSEWLGLGASFGRGQLDQPPLVGRQFCYLLDAAAGWLWPVSSIGYSVQMGLGISLFGADLLSIGARGSNVISTTTWSANLGYGLTFDR